jgi:hypothetical protein
MRHAPHCFPCSSICLGRAGRAAWMHACGVWRLVIRDIGADYRRAGNRANGCPGNSHVLLRSADKRPDRRTSGANDAADRRADAYPGHGRFQLADRAE